MILLREAGLRWALFQWGLTPSWAKDPAIGQRMINARRETVAEKPSFRNSFRKRRCLVLADGFYEWQETGKGKPKVPHYIRMKDEQPFTFARLWSRWEAPDGSEVLTCTIITGDANALIGRIHARMPMIIPPGSRDAWLDPDLRDEEAVSSLLRPFDPDSMAMYPVTRYVNSPGNEGPECIRPGEEPET